jgi:hypothetical protein
MVLTFSQTARLRWRIAAFASSIVATSIILAQFYQDNDSTESQPQTISVQNYPLANGHDVRLDTYGFLSDGGEGYKLFIGESDTTEIVGFDMEYGILISLDSKNPDIDGRPDRIKLLNIPKGHPLESLADIGNLTRIQAALTDSLEARSQ